MQRCPSSYSSSQVLRIVRFAMHSVLTVQLCQLMLSCWPTDHLQHLMLLWTVWPLGIQFAYLYWWPRCEQADASESTVVRFRVCTLLSKWIDRYTFDFIKDCPALAEKVKVWLTDVVQALVEAGDKTSKVPQQVLGKLEKMKLSGYTEKDIVQDQTQVRIPIPKLHFSK